MSSTPGKEVVVGRGPGPERGQEGTMKRGGRRVRGLPPSVPCWAETPHRFWASVAAESCALDKPVGKLGFQSRERTSVEQSIIKDTGSS